MRYVYFIRMTALIPSRLLHVYLKITWFAFIRNSVTSPEAVIKGMETLRCFCTHRCVISKKLLINFRCVSCSTQLFHRGGIWKPEEEFQCCWITSRISAWVLKLCNYMIQWYHWGKSRTQCMQGCGFFKTVCHYNGKPIRVSPKPKMLASSAMSFCTCLIFNYSKHLDTRSFGLRNFNKILCYCAELLRGINHGTEW